MRVIKGFTPNWFTAGMGTGILALDAYLLPSRTDWLKSLGEGLWIFNMGLVLGLFVLMTMKWLQDRIGVHKVLSHPVQSMFFGAIPMAMTTVVNGFFDFGPKYWGVAAYHIGAILWIANTLLALGTVFIIPYLMFTRHEHALSNMTAVWLMPIVPAEVVAASSGILILHLTNLALQKDLLIGTVVLWAFSVPLAFLMLGILFMRLVLHKLPPQEMAISTWITLGTLGTGIMGLVTIGTDTVHVFPAFSAGLVGASTLGALILWGFGIWWLVQSVLITVYYLAKHTLRFNIGWWGLTFPLGVFGGGTDLLYRQLGTAIFYWASLAFFILLAVFWLVVASFTVAHLRSLLYSSIKGADTSVYPEEEAI